MLPDSETLSKWLSLRTSRPGPTSSGALLELRQIACPLAEEVIRLRAQLAALTDPSPEAQLRRYREARELVENPPKIAYEWTTFYILGRRMWVRFPVGAIDPVAHVRTGPNEDAEKATEDARLTAAGWQLCGAIDAPAVPVQVGDTK